MDLELTRPPGRRRPLGPVVALLACLLALAGTGPATAATPPLETVDDASNVALTADGDRYGWYQRAGSEIRIVDGKRRTTTAVQFDASCRSQGVRLPRVLLACSTPPSYRLLDTRTGTATELDARPCLDAQPTTVLAGLGLHWVAGYYETSGGQSSIRRGIYLNHRTGECRAFPSEGPFVRDLDSPGLERRTAAPRACADPAQRYAAVRRSGSWYVRRCGGSDTRLCRGKDCGVPRVGTRLVTWIQGDYAYAYRLSARRRLRWRIPAHASRTYLDVLSLRGTVYLSVPDQDPDSDPVPFRILSAAVE